MNSAAAPNGRHVFRFGPFEVNARTRVLTRNGRRLKLPGLPFEVLVALLEQPGDPVSREALHKRLWPEGTFVDFDNNLNAAVARLRQTLGDSAERPRYIETVPRLGYRLVAPVDVVNGAMASVSSGAASEAELAAPASVPAETVAAPIADVLDRHRTAPWGWHVLAGRRSVRMAAIVLLIAMTSALALADWRWSAGVARESAEALERGRDLLERGDARGATRELQRAIELDDRNALAHSTLAHAIHKTSTQSLVARPPGESPALKAALRAVEIDPRCASCQGTLGLFLFYHDWQFMRAEPHLIEALRLDPNAAAIRPSYAMLLVATARFDAALEQIDRALDQRPLELTWHVIRASIFYSARRYADAIAAADRALAIDDTDRGAWEWRSRALLQTGRTVEGVHALSRVAFAEHAATLERAVNSEGAAGGLRALLDVTGDWRARVEQSWRRAPWQMHLGNHDAALDELERAYEHRNYNLMYLAVDPVYDPIRSHPRFQAILHGMGLDGIHTTGR
jgi:DNA-binding winged helix-turn-helix (wHTH) protein/tetratricopeptide (TPR) repeat protein